MMPSIDAEAEVSHMTVPVRVHHCGSEVKKWCSEDIPFNSDGTRITGKQLLQYLLSTDGVPSAMRTPNSCKIYIKKDNDHKYEAELPDTELSKAHIAELARNESYLLLTDGVTGVESFNVKVNK